MHILVSMELSAIYSEGGLELMEKELVVKKKHIVIINLNISLRRRSSWKTLFAVNFHQLETPKNQPIELP